MHSTTLLRSAITLLVLYMLSACETPANQDDLVNQNNTLKTELQSAKQKIESLSAEKRQLQADNSELERVKSVISTEKESRFNESIELRTSVRKFVQQRIAASKDFLLQGNLLDYIGGELLDRAELEPRLGTLVDLANPVPRKGILEGATGYFVNLTSLTVNVLRPINDDYLVVWKSPLLTTQKTGNSFLRFPTSVNIEAGDVIAYTFDTGDVLNFDRGTGNTRFSSKDFLLGGIIKTSSLKGASEKRAYSLGVYAILD